MATADDELIAQFAALSSNGEDNPDIVEIPEKAVKEWDWKNCILMRVMGSRITFDTTFSSALRKTWPLHPQTVIEGLGSNYFLVEFKKQEEMFKVMARSTWVCNRDMVVTRPALGPEDLINPQIQQLQCLVELHGIPPETLHQEGIQLIMKKIGEPVSEIKSFYHGGQRVYKQRMSINMSDPLKPRLPMKHPQLGLKWIYVVYENVANVCMFCARIGHESSVCPAKMRLKLLQQDDKHKEKLGTTPIPETMIGRWLTDRAFVPREHDKGQCSTEDGATQNEPIKETDVHSDRTGTNRLRRLKRPIELNMVQHRMLTMGHEAEPVEVEDDGSNSLRLNCKRAKEANPNSPSRCQ